MAEVSVDEYPKRPAFYAYKLTRLMFKTALANEIGPEACHMIIQIAHTEDATRYSKAVTFYNEQLMPVCGFANIKALDRARKKAVESGWLRYIPGGKGVAGKYWTVVPEKYVNWEDGSIDESSVPDELNANHPVSLPVSGKETGDKRETNGRQTGDKRATIYPSPNPEYKEKETGEQNPDLPDFIPVKSFCRDERITAIEIGGKVVHYDEDPGSWESEFIRLWNLLPKVHKRSPSVLDPPMRSQLQSRLVEPMWFWKRAFGQFPLCWDFGKKPNLTWFLRRGSVSEILDGSHHSNDDKPKGKSNGKQQRGADFDPSSTNSDDGKL